MQPTPVSKPASEALGRGQTDRFPVSSSVADDRATRFLRRVDIHLATLPDPKTRRDFLDRQIEGWEDRYANFVATGGNSEPLPHPADPPQAADFLLTIQGLASRRFNLRSITGDRTMITPSQQRLERAILSLLVAADQRCPAIIGQATCSITRMAAARAPRPKKH